MEDKKMEFEDYLQTVEPRLFEELPQNIDIKTEDISKYEKQVK